MQQRLPKMRALLLDQRNVCAIVLPESVA